MRWVLIGFSQYLGRGSDLSDQVIRWLTDPKCYRYCFQATIRRLSWAQHVWFMNTKKLFIYRKLCQNILIYLCLWHVSVVNIITDGDVLVLVLCATTTLADGVAAEHRRNVCMCLEFMRCMFLASSYPIYGRLCYFCKSIARRDKNVQHSRDVLKNCIDSTRLWTLTISVSVEVTGWIQGENGTLQWHLLVTYHTTWFSIPNTQRHL